MTVLASLLTALAEAARYNKHELSAPRVILWPDAGRLWEPGIELLRKSLPCLWTLGDYAPDDATGPAAWLRYQLDTHRAEETPILYLPGIERSAFRSADQCPERATHLFALQFQGQFWTQKNGKDWTPFAFLSSAEGGLGLEVSADQETRKAIQECLPALLREELPALHGHKLEAGDFRAIITKDPGRTLLRWMSDHVKMRTALEAQGSAWQSFCAVCRNTYGFDPVTDGAITAADKLVESKGAWPLVWELYKDAPQGYPGVKNLLESRLPKNLFEGGEFSPLWNQRAEARLAADLLALSSVPPKELAAKVLGLSSEHQARAAWVWARLGEAELALSVVWLGEVAKVVQTPENPATWEALADYYRRAGWKADYSILQALNEARSPASIKAVTEAIRALYLPWLEKFAEIAQALSATYPATGPGACRSLPVEQGTVYLFADGLRFDLAMALNERLADADFEVATELSSTWSALPTVTATAKPAFLPLAERLGGPLTETGFQCKERATGKALDQGRFKQLLAELGISYLEGNEVGLPIVCAFTEHGSVDKYGHAQGAKLAWRVEEELVGLQQRIVELLKAGWRKVTVVTDHGWLMLPGGLPKIELPQHLTDTRWSRCAVPGPGAQHGYREVSWFWDAAELFVPAPGVSCFLAGKEYAHGGLTMQEALIPSLTVTATKTGASRVVTLREHKWVGLRLHAVFEGAEGLIVDLRSKVAYQKTSFAASRPIAPADGQKVSLLVPDDEHLGKAAFLVVVDSAGTCVFKHPVVIGENN